MEGYKGNVKISPFRNPYITSRISGAGNMYFRVESTRPFERTGYPMTIKQEKYVHTPMGSREALKVQDPSKALLRSVQMQANVKMNKTERVELKTDAAFFKRQQAAEQGAGVKKRSFKNLFARLLGNSKLLSPGQKARWLNPGYDPREKGLWAK